MDNPNNCLTVKTCITKNILSNIMFCYNSNLINGLPFTMSC